MRLLATIGVCLISLMWVGCEAREEAALLEVSAVEPTQLTPGQRLRVRGSGFPPGRDAIVRLEGTMHHPGAEPTHVAVELVGRAASSDRLEARFTRDALRDLGGRGTLHGHVIAVFDAAHGRGRVIGRSALLEIDATTGAGDRLQSELARRREGAALVARLGLTLSDETAAGESGLAIAMVRAGSPADRAGLLAEDRLLAAERVHVQDASDILPAPGADTIRLRLARRGEAAPFDVVLPVETTATREASAETVRATSIALAWLLLFAVLFAPSAGVADWIASAARREPGPARSARQLWLRYRREIPVVGLGTMALAAIPALDRVYPMHFRLDVLLLGALATRAAIAWLGSADGGARARAMALLGAAAGVLAVAVGLGAMATVGGTTDVTALSRQPVEPWSWALVRWPIAVPALGIISLGATWKSHGASRFARTMDDFVLLGVAATTVAVLLGGWGTDDAQGPLRLARGAGYVVLSLGYWVWLRRARTPRSARLTLGAGLVLTVLIVSGTAALIALDPPDVLTAAVSRVLAGATALLLLSAATRAIAGPRARPMPLHRFA
ncbi:MAG: PDZ domain-containing protein [Sandaracinaceae bacterium]|nr:PDZ domain-containing protein [Sandaracinaceae bacterium]